MSSATDPTKNSLDTYFYGTGGIFDGTIVVTIFNKRSGIATGTLDPV